MYSLQQPKTSFSILIVEDHRAASNIIVRMVAMQFPDAVVLSAYNGMVGMELFKEHTPDIVVTDIDMPEMDGLQMATEIRSINPDTKLIVFTGCGEGDFLKNFNGIGVDTYLLKPFDLDELLTAIEKCTCQASP